MILDIGLFDEKVCGLAANVFLEKKKTHSGLIHCATLVAQRLLYFVYRIGNAMRFLAHFLYAICLVAATPIDRPATAQRSQRVLQNHAPARLLSHSQQLHHTSSFDAAPNSVGLLLTSAGKQRVMHVWLPLGKRIETRKSAPCISSPEVIAVLFQSDLRQATRSTSRPVRFQRASPL